MYDIVYIRVVFIINMKDKKREQVTREWYGVNFYMLKGPRDSWEIGDSILYWYNIDTTFLMKEKKNREDPKKNGSRKEDLNDKIKFLWGDKQIKNNLDKYIKSVSMHVLNNFLWWSTKMLELNLRDCKDMIMLAKQIREKKNNVASDCIR